MLMMRRRNGNTGYHELLLRPTYILFNTSEYFWARGNKNTPSNLIDSEDGFERAIFSENKACKKEAYLKIGH